MNIANSQWQFAEGNSATFPATTQIRPRQIAAQIPISQQVLSWLLFWPLLTLIARQVVYFTGPAVSAEFYQNGAAMTGARGSHYYLYVYLLFLLGFVLAGYRQTWAALKKNPLISMMLGLAVCSALWSASSLLTLQMSSQVGLCTLFACYLSARYTTERLMQLLIFMGMWAATLTILFVFALPAYGVFQGYSGGAWQGICDHKNTLGISMAFLLSPIFFTNFYSRGRKVTYTTLLLFLIYKSQSRGAWLYAAGMLLFIGLLGLIRRVRTRDLALLTLTTSAVAVVAITFGVHFWPVIAEHMGKSVTMTGRTGIYAEVWRSVMKHPILGYGFGNFWNPANFECQRIGLALRWPNIAYAENGVLELALQTGFLGVALVLAMIGNATVQGIRLLRSPHYSPRVGWYLTVLFLAALTNIDAGWFMTSNTLDWVLILIACIGMNQEMRYTRGASSL